MVNSGLQRNTHANSSGADKVTYERYMKLVEEFAPKDLQNRFDEDVDD
jgi:hypothetical protein